MKKPTFNLFSQTSYYIESLFEKKVLATGTCFFIIRNEKTYLITNWHVVTGRNPETNEQLGYSAVSPDEVNVKIYSNDKILECVDFSIPLYVGEDKVWLEHPVFGQRVDVIALEVSIPDEKNVISPETFIEPFNEDTAVNVKDDVFILGYPFGLTSGDIFPIWKRGSIASEPLIDIGDLPKMYIDTASRSGMSGAPVIYIEKRSIGIGDGNPGIPGVKFSSNFTKIIGVYSGLIGAKDELQAQLGIVWKYEVIDEIINQ